MPKVFTSKTQKTGEIGEHLAVRYLVNKGYSVIERNYTRKWGEIDIVAKKDGMVHFIEVKSKTGELAESSASGGYRPEDNMHPWKIKRLQRTIQTYLAEHDEIGDWQFDLIVVWLSLDLSEAKVAFLADVVL